MKPYSKFFHFIFLLITIAIVSCSEDDKVVETPNGLVSVAGADQTVQVLQEIQLDGSQSYDKNNKPFTYLWTIKTKPEASVAVFTAPNGVKTTFKPDVAGIYVIQFVIYQNGFSAKDELILTVTSSDPNGPTTVILDEDITTSTTLNDVFENSDQPDYIVTGDINVHADLTVMPGVIVEFEENKGLQIITGSLNAKGNSTNGIIFRGLNDSPAYWKGIAVYSNSENNELDYVSVKGGGSSTFQETIVESNITLVGTTVSGAAMKISNTFFSESGGYGFYAEGMSVLDGFSNNTFASNALAAAFIPAKELHKAEGTIFSGSNGFEGIETGGVVQATNVTWAKLQTGSYLVKSNIEIEGGVSIEAGATFKIKNGVTISVVDYGYLNATGSENARIIFTSEANAGRWNGLYFNGLNENNKLKYVEINNAGLNKIADSEHPGNITIGSNGKLTVENSVMRNGLGYGLVAKSTTSVNSDVVTVNTFENLQKGYVFPTVLNYPDMPEVTGVWLDYWSFNQGLTGISDNFYNVETGIWFAGAGTPWEMNNGKGFGIKIEENGEFTWTIAEHSPMNGCNISYSAEYITGTAEITSDKITFDQSYWRSKFINACDPSQNVDTNVTPFQLELPYTIENMYNLFTGEHYWQIKFTNPDNSTFSLYRK